MVTNNEAVDNFLNGKRNLAAYQFSQIISNNASLTSSTTGQPDSTTDYKNEPNCDEIAFNYAMINHFTGCHKRASLIFDDLVKRYPRNPRLWLRLAESMLASERFRMTEFEHIQQLANPQSRDHIVKTKNNHILIKVNPNYCQQQIEQQSILQRGTPSNFLLTIKSYLEKSLDLINEYNDISLLTDDHITSSGMINDEDDGRGGGGGGGGRGEAGVDGGGSDSGGTSGSNTKLSQQLAFSNPYKSITRTDLYNLKIKVQLNLAYISLCMGEPKKALNFSMQCLKSSPQCYERILAHLYHAEACILTERIDESIQSLNLEIFEKAKSLPIEHPIATGDTKRIVYGDELKRQLESGALTTVLTYNLSIAYAAKGEMSNAHKILMKSIEPVKPNPLQLLICLLYIQLQQGQLESAERTILNNLPQFR